MGTLPTMRFSRLVESNPEVEGRRRPQPNAASDELRSHAAFLKKGGNENFRGTETPLQFGKKTKASGNGMEVRKMLKTAQKMQRGRKEKKIY